MKKFYKFFGIIFRILKTIILILIIYFLFILISKYISKEISKIIINYLETILWPIVVIIAICIFRPSISSFVDELIEADIFGQKFKRQQKEIEQQERNVTTETAGDIVNIDNEFFQKIVEIQEKNIEYIKSDNEKLSSGLIKNKIELDFERIYNDIFASQIDLLRKMREKGFLELRIIVFYFHFVKSKTPVLNDWDTTKYLNFLFNNGLIEIKNNNYYITQKGQAFLFYIEKMNYQKFGI